MLAALLAGWGAPGEAVAVLDQVRGERASEFTICTGCWRQGSGCWWWDLWAG